SPEGYQTLDTLLNNYENLLHHPTSDGPKLSLIQYRLAFGYYFKGYAIEKGYLKNTQEAPEIYYQKSEAAMREVIQLDPSDIWARNYLGFFLLERSSPPSNTKRNPSLAITAPVSTSSNPALIQAMALWEESLKVNPVNPGASFLLGEAYLKQGNLKKALVYMNQSVDIPTENPQPLKEEKAFQSRPPIPALQIPPDSTTLIPR
ncbi:MAG: hypothetical protein K2X66_17975, partial [Cyanobacteria bacterium]|nr:hypothetical protein [Cyanobacteriota bacterium]